MKVGFGFLKGGDALESGGCAIDKLSVGFRKTKLSRAIKGGDQ